MIGSIPNSLHDAVIAALGQLAVRFTEERFGRWRVCCADGFALTATFEDEWVGLHAPFAKAHIHGHAVPRCAWDVMLRNATLPGAAKLALAPNRAVIHAALEFPLDRGAMPSLPIGTDEPETSLAHKLRQAIDDLKQSAHPRRNPKTRAAHCCVTAETPDLHALCADAGWPANPRSEHRVTVQLELPHGHAQALLAWDQGLRFAVSLHRIEESLPASSRQAIAVMLLQIGGAVRGVRPAIEKESDSQGGVLVLQSYLPGEPSAREVDGILSGLSVAAGMCRQEIKFLSDESISKRYLSARGWSATDGVPA